MNRPSHWIMLFTAVVLTAYVLLPRPETRPVSSEDAGPVAVQAEERPASARSVGRITGRVVDRKGWPVLGAVVRIHGAAAATTTGSDGTFRLPTTTLRAQPVTVRAPGCAAQTLSLHPREPTIVALQQALPWVDDAPAPQRREDSGLLAGEGFLRTEDGEPVSQGVVTVVETGARSAADGTGRYRIALPDGVATLLAHDDDGRVARSEPLRSVRPQGLVPLPDLVLTPGLGLRGYLRHPDGRPAEDAAMWLRGQGVHRQVRTGPGGSFAFVGLLPGAYVLEALPHEGSLGFRRPVALQSHADLDLSLVAEQPLRVRVVREDGTPLPGVWVLAEEGELRHALARADEEGWARLEGLGPGPFAFQVRAPETFAVYPIERFDEASARLTVRG